MTRPRGSDRTFLVVFGLSTLVLAMPAQASDGVEIYLRYQTGNRFDERPSFDLALPSDWRFEEVHYRSVERRSDRAGGPDMPTKTCG